MASTINTTRTPSSTCLTPVTSRQATCVSGSAQEKHSETSRSCGARGSKSSKGRVGERESVRESDEAALEPRGEAAGQERIKWAAIAGLSQTAASPTVTANLDPGKTIGPPTHWPAGTRSAGSLSGCRDGGPRRGRRA